MILQQQLLLLFTFVPPSSIRTRESLHQACNLKLLSSCTTTTTSSLTFNTPKYAPVVSPLCTSDNAAAPCNCRHDESFITLILLSNRAAEHRFLSVVVKLASSRLFRSRLPLLLLLPRPPLCRIFRHLLILNRSLQQPPNLRILAGPQGWCLH